MPARQRSIVVAVVFALLLSFSAIIASAGPAGADEPASAVRTGFDATDFGPSDDTSSGAIPLGFSMDFFGSTFSDTYVNNNGNLTFEDPLGVYTPFELSSNGTTIIAPFFADVDTDNVGSTVHYGTGTVDGHPAFGATYADVGCFRSDDPSITNDFQVVLISRDDLGAGDFDIELNYNKIVWDAGMASGGDTSCVGGSPARAGYSNGTSENSYELPGSGTDDLLDGGSQSLTAHSLNSATPGRYVFAVRNGAPLAVTSAASTLSAGDSSGSSLTVVPSASTSDAGALSGQTSDAGGTATYSVYSDSSCTVSAADTETVPVVDGTFAASQPINLPVGTYYWQVTYSGDAANNSAITTCGSSTLTVAQTPVTITADDQSTTYGGGTPALTYSVTGLPDGQDLVTEPTCTLPASHSDAGSYEIDCSGADVGSDYELVYVPGTLSVGQATATVTADSASVAFGDADPAFTYSTSGLIGDDVLTTAPDCSVPGDHHDVGAYPIVCSGADAGGNYTVAYSSGTLNVTQAPGVITADNQTVTFGDADPTFSYTMSGVSDDDLAAPPSCTVTGEHAAAGAYPIVCSGADAGDNYSLSYADGTLQVLPAPVLVTADDQTMAYGDADPTYTYTVSGLLGDDGLATAPSCTVAGEHPAAGTHPIVCSGADAGADYSVSYADGTLQVSPATAVITADDQTVAYGDTDPPFTSTVSGLVGDDELTTAATCTVAGEHSATGAYPITCSGADAGDNYSLGYAAGTLTVTTATQALTIVSNPPATGTVGGSHQLTIRGGGSTAPVTLTLDTEATTNLACSLGAPTADTVDGAQSSTATLSFDRPGRCVVRAAQDGDENHSAASPASVSIEIVGEPTTTTLTLSTVQAVHGQPVTATATVSGTGAGTVEFAVDGVVYDTRPVGGGDGSDRSVSSRNIAAVAEATPLGLPVGSHTVTARFVPSDVNTWVGSTTATGPVVSVGPATSRVALSVQATSLVATVSVDAPSTDVPTGSVTFFVAGTSVGTAPVIDGVATLNHAVSSGARAVSAVYAGRTDTAGSVEISPASASTAPADPSITATVHSSTARSRAGWYRSPVVVRFSCTAGSAALVAPCPAPVTVRRSGVRTISRTVLTTDGGARTVSVIVKLDRSRPTVRIAGVRRNHLYAITLPAARCVSKDLVSGLASCVITRRTSGTSVRWTATAVDRAGNVRRTVVAARRSQVLIMGADYSGRYPVVHRKRTYTLIVFAASRPSYVFASPVPRKPAGNGGGFTRAGKGRWAYGVTFTKSLYHHALWSFGVRIRRRTIVVIERVIR